jgi:class 3 adenylate cyclase
VTIFAKKSDVMTEWDRLEQAIQAQEALRSTLGDAVVDTTIATLREKQAAIEKANQDQKKQRKYITVLFADVSGFTKMSETRDAEEVGNIMQALWQRIDPTIVRHGGLIDKHIGDAVMALFGAPTAQENDAERAVRAALAMQAEVKTFCEEHHLSLALRIGINSGQVVLDLIGTTREYTALGDAVNVANRMEMAAPIGGILISQQTYLHVQGLLEVE